MLKVRIALLEQNNNSLLYGPKRGNSSFTSIVKKKKFKMCGINVRSEQEHDQLERENRPRIAVKKNVLLYVWYDKGA